MNTNLAILIAFLLGVVWGIVGVKAYDKYVEVPSVSQSIVERVSALEKQVNFRVGQVDVQVKKAISLLLDHLKVEMHNEDIAFQGSIIHEITLKERN